MIDDDEIATRVHVRGWFLFGGIFCAAWNSLAVYGFIHLLRAL